MENVPDYQRKSGRVRKPTKRFSGWYGLRMVTASRDNAIKENQYDTIKHANSANQVSEINCRVSVNQSPDISNLKQPVAEQVPLTEVDCAVDQIPNNISDWNGPVTEHPVEFNETPHSPEEWCEDDTDETDSVVNVRTTLNRQARYLDKVSGLAREKVAMKFKSKELRKKMLAFEPLEEITVFQRVIPPPESSDEDIMDDVPIDMAKELDGKNSRKRKRNPDNWKRNKVKRARQHGEAYTNYAGDRVSAKSAAVGEMLCHSKCKFKCTERVDDECRSMVFSSFYDLNSDAQNVHLFACLTLKKPRLVDTEATQHREVAVEYRIKTSAATQIRVCKKAFMTLHRVSQPKVDHIVNEAKVGVVTIPPSARGKHKNRPNKLPEERRQLVHEHIQMFPTESSHYSRHDNPARKYLPATLSINAMYDEYKKWVEEKGLDPVSSSTYRTIFCNDFNLGFGTPRTDTCSRCDSLFGTELNDHKANANTAFEQQRIDRIKARSEDRHYYLTFDLQKTLPLPKLSVGEAFYLRQLWLYNAGVHLVSKDKEGAYFQIWTESEGHRGVKEVCSALNAFFCVADIGHNDCTSSLVAWSDSCSGQNKNFKMLAFWQYLILVKRFRIIEHKFPLPGHSFLDSDRDFAKVEVGVRKRENVYSVDEYQSVMTSCMRNPQPIVTRIADKMFDIDSLIHDMGLIKKTVNTSGSDIQLRDKVRWIRMSEFGVYQYKHSFSEEENWKDVVIRRNTADPVEPPILVMLPSTSVPIATPKLKDLEKQMKFIPTIHQGFYKTLRATSAPLASNVVTELNDLDTSEVTSLYVTDAAMSVTQVSNDNWFLTLLCTRPL